VDSWLGGRAEPSPAEVFALEEALHLAPGCLSRELGYLPVGIAGHVEEAIGSSQAVDADGRQLALGVWCTLVAQCAARRRLQSRAGSTSNGAGLDDNGENREPQLPPVVSMAEAGRMLGICRSSVRRLAERGELPFVRIGRRILITRASIEALIEQNTT
jgi:excisionase family DNA binding protein